jgi:hypothetical protein
MGYNHLDTIPGRQSMAACYFLHKRFDDVLVYLSSIKVRLFSYSQTPKKNDFILLFQ